VTTLELFTGGTLTAAVYQAEPGEPNHRVAEGILVPYGQPGRTNLGPKRIARGALRLVAEAPVVGLYGHDRERSVSRLIASEDRAEGLWGRLRIAETPTGDLLLAELRGGVRDGLSVELSDLVLDASDPNLVTSARLDAVAHVPLPAYDSARVSALAATQHAPTGEPSVTAPAPTAAPAAEPTAPAAPALDYAALAAALAPHLTAAAAPAGLPTGALTAAPAAPGLAPSAPARPDLDNPVVQAATLQAQVARDPSNRELHAALVDITQSGLSLFDNPSTLGEKLWEGAGYSRRFVSLFRQQPLTAMKGTGWQWVERPQVADYAGNKAGIPSNQVSVEPTEWTAERCAGGWDIDRKFRDFGDAQFWTEFYAAQTESYLELSDARAAAALVDYAFDVTDAATYPTHYNLPAGYSTAAGGLVVAQADVLQAAALATAILEDTPRVRRGPDYIVMNTADWLSLSTLTSLDLPAFLSLLKVDPGNFQRSSLVPKGSIIAGIRQAATFRELGATPIRVEALDVARGGIDSAVFGYTASHMDRPGGIIAVPLAASGG
jgi:HK97 family phage prohead protease